MSKKNTESPEKEIKTTEQAAPTDVEQEAGVDYKEQFMRVSADLANFKRRVDKDRLTWSQAGKATVLKSLLGTLDDLDRAIASSPSDQDVLQESYSSWISGLKLVQKNLAKALDDMGVKKIDCSGQFDPDLHEALMQVDSDDHQSGDVVLVLSNGYTMNDQVLKHAQVSVAK